MAQVEPARVGAEAAAQWVAHPRWRRGGQIRCCSSLWLCGMAPSTAVCCDLLDAALGGRRREVVVCVASAAGVGQALGFRR